jgi:dolichyl-phosphate-mannose--protein O-mannosyl transferase
LILIFIVPNVSFQVYAPSFLKRFFESHAVMLQGNSDLKVKEGEVSSKPWQWPINYRVKCIIPCSFLNLTLLNH